MAKSRKAEVDAVLPGIDFSKTDYQIVLEATPLNARRTFMHLSYAYTLGLAGRMAMSAYLAGAGRDKRGFSVDSGPRAVVVKGGHLDGPPVDVLATRRRTSRARASRLPHGMHGTGCAFASAIAAGLAHGRPVESAVADARRHVRALIRSAVKTKDGGWLRP